MQYATMISIESPAATRRGAAPRCARGCSAPASRSPRSCCPRAAAAAAPTSKQNPGTPNNGPAANYNGPAPSTPDVQAVQDQSLGQHSGEQPLRHVPQRHGRPSADVRAPRRHQLGVLPLPTASSRCSTPQDSTMVGKVGGGHNCWLASNAACGDILTTWITNWAGSTASTAARKIELEPPVLRDPGQSKNFPADQGVLFSTTVYPVLEQHCSECHASDTALKQQPFFAEGPPSDADAVALAYEAAKSKMNLDDPSISRFVLRLRNEFHNCWTQSCANDANAMQAAIQQLQQRRDADGRRSEPCSRARPRRSTKARSPRAATATKRTSSRSTSSRRAKTAARRSRARARSAFDTSGVDPAMDLTLSGNVQWFGGWGLNFAGGKAQASTGSSAKLKNLIASTGEYSIEAWVAPGNVVQEDMRIVSYSASLTNRNFNLGQTMYNYDFFNRSNLTNANGDPQLSTPDADEVLQASCSTSSRRSIRSPAARSTSTACSSRSSTRRPAARSRTGTTRTRSCSATRCRTTACGTA